MIRHGRCSVVAVLASAYAMGCSGTEAAPTTASEPEQIASALERDNGGLDRANEAPGFGEPDADAVPMSGEGADEDRALGEALPGSRLYRLALLWGHMPAARETGAPRPEPTRADFSGSIALDRGAIAVSKTIRFDGGDRLEQRSSVSELRFVSHTAPHVDGLLVSVRVPEGERPVVRFRTTTLNADLDLASGALADGAIRAPDGENGLIYMSYEDRPGCASGFVVGRWRSLRDDLGVFHGRVTGDRGATLGHVRGIWGHAQRADKDVFFGKYINQDGEFRGLFGGAYGEGLFRGIWGARDPESAGVIAGRYGDGRLSDDGKGVFLGRFRETCPE